MYTHDYVYCSLHYTIDALISSNFDLHLLSILGSTFAYIKQGISVDDVDAVVMFKGFKYWNESLGEYRQFFNGYEERAEVPDLEVGNASNTIFAIKISLLKNIK